MSGSRVRFLAAGAALVGLLLAAGASASDKFDRGAKLDDARRPASGQALVYFVRPQVMGAAIKTKVFADGELLGITGAKTFLVWEGPPGKHEFATASENAGILTADLAADRIYYVQVAMHMGAMKARTHFEVARAGSEALEEISAKHAEVELSMLTEEGRAWVAEDRADIDAKIAKYRAKGEEIEALAPGDGYEKPPWQR